MTDAGGPDIARPSTDAAGAIVEMWVDLATDQRRHGSHLVAEPNRERVREAILRGIATDSVLVATVDDELVGFVTFAVESGVYEQDVRRGLVENLYVVPDHRGEGVGTSLLESAEARLRERGCDVLFLEMLTANEGARRFYRRAGYEPHRIELERPAREEGSGDDEEGHGTDDASATENDTHTRDD